MEETDRMTHLIYVVDNPGKTTGFDSISFETAFDCSRLKIDEQWSSHVNTQRV